MFRMGLDPVAHHLHVSVGAEYNQNYCLLAYKSHLYPNPSACENHLIDRLCQLVLNMKLQNLYDALPGPFHSKHTDLKFRTKKTNV